MEHPQQRNKNDGASRDETSPPASHPKESEHRLDDACKMVRSSLDKLGLDRSLAVLVIARSFVSVGFSMMMLVGPDIVLANNRKSSTRADSALAIVETLTTFSAFFARPLIGQITDSQGRKWGLFLGPLLSAFARLLLVVRPGNMSYALYRVINLLAMIPLFQSFTATLADRLGGRGSDKFVRFNKFTYMWLAFVRSLALNLAARIKNKNQIVLVSVASNLIASGMFFFGVEESLTPENRKPFVLKTAANPFFFVSFFAQTRQLKMLALLTLLRSIGDYNQTLTFFRRAKFSWGLRERARIQQLSNMVELVGPLYSVSIRSWLGNQRTAVLSELACAVGSLNVVFSSVLSSTGATLYLNPLIYSVFDYDSFAPLTSTAADSVAAGQGELSSALMNLRFPLGLTLPNFFSALFTRSLEAPALKGRHLAGTAPFLLVACVHIFNAVWLVPYSFQVITPHDGKQQNLKPQ